ncbi:crotonase/enoyl-CoA hydratase family protein [Aeromicrobium sp. CF4.19]|uniref:crotonase/enoyl-CoA hydratase family protein n=1 Tax=Aeromicrobium sp. CF4.19 TaxID=3373082 RepID=UPI003EE4B2D2
MPNPVLFSREGHVETWTLNLPDSRNPISAGDVVETLVEGVERVNADSSVRAVVLTGAGTAFSAGGDVKAMRTKDGYFGGAPHAQRDGYRSGIQRIPRAMYGCEVPIIAAVNGPAVGAGCDLALMCDIRIASTQAFFAESFVMLGIVPGDGGAWFLPRVVGPSRAAEMTFTGDRVDAETALSWGLVSRVVSPEDLLATATALAQRIATNPPQAVRMAKRLLKESPRQDLDGLLELSGAMQAIAHHTDDHTEAVEAFFEKRTGQYHGR